MSSEIILSICIPTYNRAEHLEECLQSIVKQAGNKPEVEVLISDNVSDDDTRAVSEGYARKYSNVKYYRNETNIGGDRNFIRVLSLGNGKYVKLLNDYAQFKEGGVLKMLEIVNNHSESKEILFFANGASYLKEKDFYYSKDLDEFLRVCSFNSQWISTIGFWKDDFDRMMNYYQFKTKSFFQTELLFENFNLGKKAVTYTRQLLIFSHVHNKTTSNNFFDTFINAYFNTIIVGLKNEKRISKSTYNKEKNKFFTDWVFSWYKKVRIKRNHGAQIDDKGMESIIFKTFGNSPIFYLYLLYLPFYLIGFYFKKMVRYFKR